MKAGSPFSHKPIQGIPMLKSLIELLFHMCRCAQMHCSPASDTMNLLFCVCPRPIYRFFTADVYPDAFAPIPPVVDKIPDYTSCTNNNDRAATCARHALDKKTRADIITMNAALTNVSLMPFRSGSAPPSNNSASADQTLSLLTCSSGSRSPTVRQRRKVAI